MRRDGGTAAWRRAAALAAHVSPRDDAASSSVLHRSDASSAPAGRRGPIVLIGGAVMDIQAWPCCDAAPSAGTTVPGEVRRVPGGVARNIAAVLAALPCAAHEAPLPPPLLVSAVGDDADGAALLAHLRALGLPTRGVRVVPGRRTASVAAVFGAGGDIAAAVADCGLVEEGVTHDWVIRFASDIANAPACLLDANAAPAALAAAAALAVQHRTPLWLEPVSVAKAARCVPLLALAAFVSPNRAEAAALAGRACGGGDAEADADVARDAEAALAAGCGAVITTLGPRGALLSMRAAAAASGPALGQSARVQHLLLPPAPAAAVVSTAGAGDSLVAAALAALARGADAPAALAAGLAAAAVVVARPENAPPKQAWPDAEQLASAARQCLARSRPLMSQ